MASSARSSATLPVRCLPGQIPVKLDARRHRARARRRTSARSRLCGCPPASTVRSAPEQTVGCVVTEKRAKASRKSGPTGAAARWCCSGCRTRLAVPRPCGPAKTCCEEVILGRRASATPGPVREDPPQRRVSWWSTASRERSGSRRSRRKRFHGETALADARVAATRWPCSSPRLHELIRAERSGGHRVLQGGSDRSVVVVHDELDLPFGQVRLKPGGGEAGHNGLGP